MHHRHMQLMNAASLSTTSQMATCNITTMTTTTTTTPILSSTSIVTTTTTTIASSTIPITTAAAAVITTTTITTKPTLSTTCNTTASTSAGVVHQRRRKKRPNYGTRTVEVRRGYNGFGFTISGQQPCRLSCIVAESPADQAGLRNGDFLISINGLNVSKLPHETVVQLIGNSFGSIRMQIAENYYSDSSDEENALQRQNHHHHHHHQHHQQQQHQQHYNMNWRGAKPRYLQHRTKLHRMRNSPQNKRNTQQQNNNDVLALNAVSACAAAAALEIQTLRPLIEDMPLSMKKTNSSTNNSNNVKGSLSSDVGNVSAMVRVPSAALEYRAILGYMGTIEMPKQISHSSKLQTVRSCIRKLRQEKRQPTTVLMVILPDCLRLQSINGSILASYSSSRLNYVSSSSESENRFFGLITSAVHTTQDDDKEDIVAAQYNREHADNDEDEVGEGDRNGNGDEQRQHVEHDHINYPSTANISISNSCHVFVVNTKLCEHQQHLQRANEFRIQCTRDPITSLCLEFPNNSEYVVNLIRSMYTMRILPPATRQNSTKPSSQLDDTLMGAVGAAHSPQPSNHSEMSTTTSNSDSGIGFHNDCNNISDRIVVVDFPGIPELRMRNNAQAATGAYARPARIFNNFNNFDNSTNNNNNREKRLTVRAMPDPKTPTALTRPNLLASFSLIKSPATSLTATRSCDDVLALMEHYFDNNNYNNRFNNEHDDDDDDEDDADDDVADNNNNDDYDDDYVDNRIYRMSMQQQQQQQLLTHVSMDDISLHSTATASTAALNDEHNAFLHPSCLNNRKTIMSKSHYITPNRLSPQVYSSPTKLINNDNVLNNTKNNNKPQITTTTTTTTTTTGNLKKSKLRFSIGFQAFDESSKRAAPIPLNFDMETWSSLQNLNASPTKTACLDITNSEPELGNQALPSNASPFRRAWAQSSFRGTRTEQQEQRTHESPLVRRAASMTASDNDVYIKSMETSADFKDELKQALSQQQINRSTTTTTPTTVASNTNTNANTKATIAVVNNKINVPQISINAADASNGVGVEDVTGVAAWITSFERLLAEPAGLQTFAEFLKKEFSAENIYFWTACERFRQLDNESERATQAAAIFAKHLANGAMEPVNVDSQARNLTEEKLTTANIDIFAHAQKQIFNLMKFDSYPRFIRSDLYKSCVEAEQKRQPLPYTGEDLDDLLKTNLHQNTTSKLKKSASNAEDRRRKSLLPWHRKTRSKSRDRPDTDNRLTNHLHATGIKLPQLTASGSLKIASLSQNSISDIHSSRSSLSSFDAMPSNMNGHISDMCSLCRVILSDGATTIVQTRPDETVGQMVLRLLEKRGLTYQYYDVVVNGSTKSIDLNSPAQATVAGKEVLIEQRVAFKLDLPDPKVISVKSKPKKQLHEVIRPILHKYNHSMEGVQVILRDTRTPLDLSLPVTAVDGQRLQIVLLNSMPSSEVVHDGIGKFLKPALPKNVSFPKPVLPVLGRNGGTSQSTLDEITNKVFNELLQGKVEAHDKAPLAQPQDNCSLKSDDCESETSSSIFERIRRRDTNIPVFKLKSKKKSTGSQHSEESSSTQTSSYNNAPLSSTAKTNIDVKKPIIAKLKAGVKLQVTERVAEHQDELLEGLKRAQLARLEDQRGTEINSELPDFLKNNKDNGISAAASKLRKIRANLSPLHQSPIQLEKSINDKLPQPAPRLSITNKLKSPTNNVSPTTSTSNYKNCNIQSNSNGNGMSIVSPTSPIKVDNIDSTNKLTPPATSILEVVDNNSVGSSGVNSGRGPPPLPPKPKVLPIKPSNWSGSSSFNKSPKSSSSILTAEQSGIVGSRCAFLEEPSSSFV